MFDKDNPTLNKPENVYSLLDKIPTDPIQSQNLLLDGPRGQLDTGAKVSCTNLRYILHKYRPYTSRHKSPIKLTAAIDGETLSIIPEGIGKLKVPAPNENKFILIDCYYSPRLSSTLISENSFYQEKIQNYSGQTITKYFSTNSMTLTCYHKRSSTRNVTVHGTILDGQCFTHPLLLPDLDQESPYANCATSSAFALQADDAFRQECELASQNTATCHRNDLWKEISILDIDIPTAKSIFTNVVETAVPINAIRAKTAKLLWHQRLGHPCDEYLYNAHKFIDGVPKFSQQTSVLDQCPTCIQAKQSKQSPGKHSTRVATQPYQGLSIDFSFSGMKSANSDRRKNYEGINGETAWILVSDHFTGMKHGDTRISKASPLVWLEHFFSQYNPKCSNKYVHLDQGGELFNNPDVRNLFSTYGYEILPTGADSSHQNGPVERAHRTLGNSIRALLTGAHLPIKFWPYAFYHSMRLANAFPERGEEQSPLEKATAKKENLTSFRTFGCRVWVRPPGRKSAKFQPNSRKGIFLGFVPYSTRNILWYDLETTRVKIAFHARFDEGMNDLPFESLPPNVKHLQRTDEGQPFPIEPDTVSTSSFTFSVEPFADVLHQRIQASPTNSNPLYGLVLATDDLLQRTMITDVKPKSPAARLFPSHKAAKSKLIGAYVMSVNHNRVFSLASTTKALRKCFDQGVDDLPITFALAKKLTKAQLRRETNEYGLFAPTTKWDIENEAEDTPFLERTPISSIRTKFARLTRKAIAENKNEEDFRMKVRRQLAPIEDDLDLVIPNLDLHSLRAISKLHKPENGSLPFDSSTISDDIIMTVINAINSKATTPEEQAIGHFTRRKLKKLSTWNEWEAGERKQLDQFTDLQMFGEPILPPDDPRTIILRPHWQYHVKRDGTRRARQCCNGSKYAAPLLHAIAMTYSSCVEHPIQRLFFALAAHLNLKVYGGDAKDAYGHSPGPETSTYVTIDDQYADWYKHKYGKEINRRKVLPVLRALQGHPESGRLWETHINKILQGPKLNFKTTTHDKTIYTTVFNGEKVYLLRQVDDFSLACTDESIADAIYDIIGNDLKLPTEDKVPFTKLGLVTDFNGIDVEQSRDFIEISCSNYIDRIMTSHGWETDKMMQPSDKPVSPLPTEVLTQLQKHTGPSEGTNEHQNLQDKMGFSYRTLLGEMMFAYVSCRPDIGYAITLMSKYGSNPSQFHYSQLKNIAKYLRSTKHWGIKFSRSSPMNEFEPSTRPQIDYPDKDLPEYPEDPKQGKLICYVDAAYGNDPKRRRSTTGYALTYAGGAIVYRSKAQSITAQSSTESEVIAAVTAAKTVRYVRSVLTELGFPQDEPTPIYEDNASAIDIVNSQKPTERTRHMEIRYFAIQDWKQNNEILLLHIPGIINPSDDLTKPLGYMLHNRHARFIMNGYNRNSLNIKDSTTDET